MHDPFLRKHIASMESCKDTCFHSIHVQAVAESISELTIDVHLCQLADWFPYVVLRPAEVPALVRGLRPLQQEGSVGEDPARGGPLDVLYTRFSYPSMASSHLKFLVTLRTS